MGLKTRMMPLPDGRKRLTICPFVRHTNGIGRTDWRTDGQKWHNNIAR